MRKKPHDPKYTKHRKSKSKRKAQKTARRITRFHQS